MEDNILEIINFFGRLFQYIYVNIYSNSLGKLIIGLFLFLFLLSFVISIFSLLKNYNSNQRVNYFPVIPIRYKYNPLGIRPALLRPISFIDEDYDLHPLRYGEVKNVTPVDVTSLNIGTVNPLSYGVVNPVTLNPANPINTRIVDNLAFTTVSGLGSGGIVGAGERSGILISPSSSISMRRANISTYNAVVDYGSSMIRKSEVSERRRQYEEEQNRRDIERSNAKIRQDAQNEISKERFDYYVNKHPKGFEAELKKNRPDLYDRRFN